MKKAYYLFIIIIILIFDLSLNVAATDDIDFDNLQNDINSELSDIIDKDIKDVLEEIGINSLSFDEIYNISFNNITVFFADTLKDKVVSYFSEFFKLLSVIIICSIISTLFDYESGSIQNSICNIIIILLAVRIISSSVAATVSVLETGGKFILSFAPIYTLLISLAGNTASALTYNTFVIFLGELISSVISFGIADFMGIYYCLGISFSINESINLGRYISVINRLVSTVLGLFASIFTGFLSFKSILSVSLDSVSVKSIRFLISSMIPVVGSSISDAYSSLIGSINLIKSSVALVGIIVIAIINVPIILENLVCYISFSMLAYLSESFSSHRSAEVLRFFACGVRILLLLCLFEMFIVIITIGIMLSVKGGV